MNTFIKCLEIPKNVVAKSVRNPSIRQIFKLTYREQLHFVHYLDEAQESSELSALADEMQRGRKFFDLIDAHFQLPCTRDSRRRRADWLEKNGYAQKTIYLLGDDDLLSVELCHRGFQHVVVADCDRNVLNTIHKLTQDLAKRPLLIQADFAAEELTLPDADLVMIDPPYNEEWALIFLQTALRCLRKSGDSRLVMMINPFSPWA